MTIVAEIKREGDAAVRRWALELDGIEPAPAVADPELLPRDALLALADRVRRWHEAQRPADVSLEVEEGVLLDRRWIPLETVGIYVPRNLVSTLVMCAVSSSARRPPAPGSLLQPLTCSGSTRCGLSEGLRPSAGSRTSARWTRSSARGTPT
jgi:histidinol dehydrogenase